MCQTNYCVCILHTTSLEHKDWDGLVTSKGCKKPEWSRHIYSWKPISRRPIGRPKICWEDDVRKDIQKSKVPNWKTLVQDRRRWKELVEKAKTLHKEL